MIHKEDRLDELWKVKSKVLFDICYNLSFSFRKEKKPKQVSFIQSAEFIFYPFLILGLQK